MSNQPQPISGAEWAYRDFLISLCFGVFLAVAALALIMVPKAAENIKPGKMIVQLFWDNKVDADIDLWVKGPGDNPVGYTARTGTVFDLLHDHRGYTVEGDYSNTEFSTARNLPEGQYTINAVLYNSRGSKLPIHTWVKVQLLTGATPIDLFKVDGWLKEEREEITLLSFRIDAEGKLIPDSQSSLQQHLWRK